MAESPSKSSLLKTLAKNRQAVMRKAASKKMRSGVGPSEPTMPTVERRAGKEPEAPPSEVPAVGPVTGLEREPISMGELLLQRSPSPENEEQRERDYEEWIRLPRELEAAHKVGDYRRVKELEEKLMRRSRRAETREKMVERVLQALRRPTVPAGEPLDSSSDEDKALAYTAEELSLQAMEAGRKFLDLVRGCHLHTVRASRFDQREKALVEAEKKAREAASSAEVENRRLREALAESEGIIADLVAMTDDQESLLSEKEAQIEIAHARAAIREVENADAWLVEKEKLLADVKRLETEVEDAFVAGFSHGLQRVVAAYPSGEEAPAWIQDLLPDLGEVGGEGEGSGGVQKGGNFGADEGGASGHL